MAYLRGKKLQEKFNALNFPPERLWENLTLSNDFMFGKVMQNEKLCAELLRRIFPDIEIGKIVYPKIQEYSRYGFDLRGARFDMSTNTYDERKIFCVDAQNQNKHDLGGRTWDYLLSAANDSLKKGKRKSGSYKDRPEVYVIFICTFQPFDDDRHIYTFDSFCRENKRIELETKAHTVFLSTKGKKRDVSRELKSFLNFFDGRPTRRDLQDPFIQELYKEVAIARQSSEWREAYMRLSMRENEIAYEAREEAHAEDASKITDFLRKVGISDDIVRQASSLILGDTNNVNLQGS